MTTKKKNFHARDVTTEHKSKRPKSRKESSHNYSEELQREVPVETFNNWACCDICQKWRLLPNGMNPKVLPKEWECCMQYWLPNAMTSCITSEAETTNFMNLHHHASLPEGNSNHEGSAPSTCSDTLRGNPHLANGISTANSVGKKMEQIGDELLNNSMHELKGSFSSLNGTMKEHLEFHARKKFKHVDVIDTLMSGKSVFPVKKRKAREWHDTQNNQETAMRRHHLGKRRPSLGRNASSPSQVSHLISSVKVNGLECATGETYYNLADLDRLTEEFEDKNVAQHGSSEHKKVNELDRLCPMRKCQPSSAALMAMKEARELKHAADRMKNVEQELERATIYFQAALKFLQAASLSEPSSVENMKYEELNESLKIYIETAAFCEFCALEYDRSKEIAFSALAYKCAEVAYFKVAFLKSHFASKDHQELQETIHAFWPADSPSSSTSDLVNLNHPGALEKITCAKVVSSLQNSDSHAIASRHSLHRWLDYAQVSVSALEASRKSQNALAVASASLGKNGCDSIASLKETLNFGFHNVEELLRRIRASMEFFYH
ncbi:hypothetical protein KSP39_PZI002718 [Platanthera zijinensis]|uniref:CW-type domain-containing protein n=1 Tax=Platanthera zijinensis TaxID=2320716 RepID=A0AAP0C0Q8_9ASPA